MGWLGLKLLRRVAGASSLQAQGCSCCLLGSNDEGTHLGSGRNNGRRLLADGCLGLKKAAPGPCQHTSSKAPSQGEASNDRGVRLTSGAGTSSKDAAGPLSDWQANLQTEFTTGVLCAMLSARRQTSLVAGLFSIFKLQTAVKVEL